VIAWDRVVHLDESADFNLRLRTSLPYADSNVTSAE
jgi:hypothetical protein